MPTATLTPALLTPALDPLETFLEHCHQRHYTSKSMIICADDPCESLFFIVQGSVTILLEQATKNEMIVAQLYVQRRKKGFLDVSMVVGSPFDSPYYF